VSEAGYTLTETLAALAVIGLAIGGLSLGMQVVGAQQAALGGVVLTAQSARAAETWLERRLADAAPFRAHEPERLSGDAEGFRFDCARAQPCAAGIVDDDRGRRLRLFAGEGEPLTFRLADDAATRFVYRGAGDLLAAWPPTGGARQALSSVALLQGEGPAQRVVFETRIRIEQPLDCQFDAILQDCR
jgi:prepilin-type N-terminal cleavage/methylation domain-containing protein